MRGSAFRVLVLVLLGLCAASVTANAADAQTTAPARRAIVREAPPPSAVAVEAEPPGVGVEEKAKSVQPAPIAFGCKRIYRCDSTVCEWRRGCWGIYGYVEGPYFNLELARRQWERDGWPTPQQSRQR